MFTAFGSFNPMWKLLDQPRDSVYGGVDVFERDGVMHLVIDAPGVTAEDLKVQSERGVLTVEIDRRITPDPSDRVLINQRPYGQRSLRFQISDHYRLDQAAAELDAGVLTITLPARSEELPRAIAVQSRSDATPVAS